ncbi:glycosyltransferase family 2 protein [Aurantiacibacter suaedae]|uniref:glycosyltransferase family 2 protein n=1 Tax=Aurantiacibacter suaedae TaxID=2545755 RepID=UPI0019D522FC|nr:glycosyltransferase [Aurantiacibacter suaedae]
MSVYNGQSDVALAIDSILAQTYPNFEFLIIDDGSTDDTPAILADYARRDARIRVISQKNTGLTLALRRGVEEARGQFIARMDADDISLPTRFEKQMALFEAQPDLVAVTTLIEHFKDIDKKGYLAPAPKSMDLLPLYICFRNPIGGHGQVIFSKAAYLAAGGYDPECNLAEDYDLWTRLLRIGRFGMVNEILYRYRTGHESISSLNKMPQAKVSSSISRREYKRLVGSEISDKVGLALRFFWWRASPESVSLTDTMKSSLVMLRAVKIFFANNPELEDHEFAVRREIAARWRGRIKQTSPMDFGRKFVMLGNTFHWGVTALTAKARHGS